MGDQGTDGDMGPPGNDGPNGDPGYAGPPGPPGNDVSVPLNRCGSYIVCYVDRTSLTQSFLVFLSKHVWIFLCSLKIDRNNSNTIT